MLQWTNMLLGWAAMMMLLESWGWSIWARGPACTRMNVSKVHNEGEKERAEEVGAIDIQDEELAHQLSEHFRIHWHGYSPTIHLVILLMWLLDLPGQLMPKWHAQGCSSCYVSQMSITKTDCALGRCMVWPMQGYLILGCGSGTGQTCCLGELPG